MTIRSAMKTIRTASAVLLASPLLLQAGDLGKTFETGTTDLPELKTSPDWFTGNDVSFFGISPHLHVINVVGSSTAPRGSLATDHHDPQRNGYTLQGLEPGVSIRWGDHVEGFATYSAYTDDRGNLEGEWEEWFGKLVNLPGGFELRGGRFLNRFAW